MNQHTRRLALWLTLFWLLSGLSLGLYAQEASPDDNAAPQEATNDLTVLGSGIAMPVMESLIEAAATDLPLATNITGTRSGFERFCAGEAPMTLSTRPIKVAEDARCINNDIAYAEYVIAHHILAYVVYPADSPAEFPFCLTEDNLNTLLRPSSAGNVMSWERVGASEAVSDLQIFLPQTLTPTYALLDRLIVGDGLRRDVTQLESDAAILDEVAATPGALGVVRLSSLPENDNAVQILNINSSEAGCVPPSVASVEQRAYTHSETFILYVNQGAEAQLNPLLTTLTDPATADVVAATAYSAPTETAYENNARVLAGEDLEDVIAAETTFEIPDTLSGEINLGGAAHAFPILENAANALSNNNEAYSVNFQIEGEAAGIRRLCNGELDLTVTFDGLNEEQAANCDANNINTVSFPLGSQVTVVLANEADAFATCLTTEQLRSIWSVGGATTSPVEGASEAEVTPEPSPDETGAASAIDNWNAVADAFPDQAMTLFGTTPGNAQLSLLLTRPDGPPAPPRLDTEQDNDPLYRAAAVGNVPGALTYLSWADYQRVLANEQQNIQVVAVNAGNGCVVPDETTINDGTYPLTRPALLTISQPSLAEIPTRAYLWQVYSDETYRTLSNVGFEGFAISELPDLREDLQLQFELAAQSLEADATDDEIILEVTPEATPELDAEATPETSAQPEATPETTPETNNE